MSAKHRATRSSSPERMRRTGAGSASRTSCHGSTVSLARSRSAPCRANASTTEGSNQLPDRSRSIDMTASTPASWWTNSAWVATSLSRAARVISTPASPRGPPVPSQRSNCWAIAAATRSPSPRRPASSAPASQTDAKISRPCRRSPATARPTSSGRRSPLPRPVLRASASISRRLPKSARSAARRDANSSPPNHLASNDAVAVQPRCRRSEAK